MCGDLFFALERTAEQAKANLELTYVQAPLTANVTLPNGKKIKITKLASSLPDIPLLSNPKKIAKHTRLVALDDLSPNKIRVKMEEEKKIGTFKAQLSSAITLQHVVLLTGFSIYGRSFLTNLIRSFLKSIFRLFKICGFS